MKLWRVLLLATAVTLLAACGANNQAETPPDTTGYDYASGGRGFSVVLKEVGMQANNIEIRPADELGTPGYAYVIVTMTISNQSTQAVLPASMVLVDQHLNEYVSWQTNVPFGAELQPLPLAIDQNQTEVGQQVFIVPNSALNSGLHLRWESVSHESRMEIFLGDLQQPAS